MLATAPEAGLQTKEVAPEPALSETDPLLEHAQQLAREQALPRASTTPSTDKPTSLLAHLTEYEQLLQDAHAYFSNTAREALSFSYAAEWLLDNFYLLKQAVRQIRQDLPPSYYRQLPKLTRDPWTGYPRIYALARAFTQEVNALLDSGQLRRFVHTYQTVTPLTIGELWALPIMLSFSLVEYLATAIAQVTELPLAQGSAALVPHIKAGHEDTSVANSVVSLRTLATEDWKAFFEELSPVEQVLRDDPARVYPQMDFETRDHYRKVVEELAQQTGYDEIEVAQQVINLAREADRDQASPHLLRRQHVGYYLIAEGQLELEARLAYRPTWPTRLKRWPFKHATLTYLGSLTVLTSVGLWLIDRVLLAAGGSLLSRGVVALLALVPVSSAAITLLNWALTHLIQPRILPRLELEESLPPELSTMLVMPALITRQEDVDDLLRQMEMHYLRNATPNLYFALLTDFADAATQNLPGDNKLVEYAVLGTTALNDKYGTETVRPFFFFHRRRLWNAQEGVWMGWERKRGKLHEFNYLLRGSAVTSFSTVVGERNVLPQIKFVITVDADTIIPRGQARHLIGTLAHPLNQAEFDPQTGDIVAGYTVLQPRTEINPVSVNRSLFTRIFAGDTGLDLYTLAVSDVYQDLFGEGLYVGKGIYEVDDFEHSLQGRIPENALLSHDLFEGVNGRVGLVTNVVLLEDYPPHYLVHTHRLQRWIRGDWQLLPWVLNSKRNGVRLSVIDRWKIVDNLRRSLFMPTLLALFLVGWIGLPGSVVTWTLIPLALLSAPLFVSLLNTLVGLIQQRSPQALRPLRYDLARWFLAIAFMPYEALLVLDAIGVTLVRMFITRKHLLQWVTAAHAARLFGTELDAAITWRHMISSLITSLAIIILIGVTRPAVLLVALPLLLIWMLAPSIAFTIDRPLRNRTETLSSRQHQELRLLARRTWLFFERFVGPEDNWLPPDHFQETPRGLPAHRTSPTNIGLLLLSTLGAYDLGYIGILEMALRSRDTFDTLLKLERYRGHWLNWYDTRTLQPLPPAYVSTVDSGNLAACLLVLKQACVDLPRTPVVRWQRRAGLLDTLAMLNEAIEAIDAAELKSQVTALQDFLATLRQQILEVDEDAAHWFTLVEHLSQAGWETLNQQLVRLVEANVDLLDVDILRDLRLCADRLQQHLEAIMREMLLLTPWLRPLSHAPDLFLDPLVPEAIRVAWQDVQRALPATLSLAEIHTACETGLVRLQLLQQRLTEHQQLSAPVQDWCTQLTTALNSARLAIGPLLIGYQDLIAQADEFFQAMDFRFLCHPQRKVFHIGYNLAADRLDNNFYDLLASEARIASLIAIAKREVPQTHWLHLARPLTQVNGRRALLSWSGTMFEYLMPTLFMRSAEGTLLDQSVRAAVDYQINYGHAKGVPWGISESAYYQFDAALNYQYRAFGVPALGFKRGLGEDLVIAPYASLLALAWRPKAVLENIQHLKQRRLLSHFGLYESVDFTKGRLPPQQDSATIRAYMAHHQGMILLALTNYLGDNSMVERFHREPRIQSVELLLQEQLPPTAPLEFPQTQEVTALRPPEPQALVTGWRVPLDTPLPQVNVLSNGRYSVFLTNAGSGYSHWQELDLTRWQADTTLDDWGSWIYLKDLDSADDWSATLQPGGRRSESQEVYFYPHLVEFHTEQHDIASTLEITVAPDDDVEIRRLTLVNHTDRPRRLNVLSYAEITLAAPASYQRHPAFNKLFIESEYLPHVNALVFRRRLRAADEKPVFLLHTLLGGRLSSNSGAHESDRLKFLGRGHSVRTPVALEQGQPLSGTVGATLDPIMSLGQIVELKPHASAQLVYMTIVHRSREVVLRIAQRYRSGVVIHHTFDQARQRSEIALRQLGLTSTELERYQQLLSVLLYPYARLRAEPEVLASNTKGQPGLWAYGISGDYPILLVQITGESETPLVLELLQAHTYWRERQLMIDLVILNVRESGYAQEVENRMQRLLAQTQSEGWVNRRGGIFILTAQRLSESDRVLLYTTARAILRGKNSLADQLQGLFDQQTQLPPLIPALPHQPETETPILNRPTDLLFDNGYGGFTPDGREYVIYLQGERRTPNPWINVIANPEFGCWVSELGGGYSWSLNSGENRLTPWRNDPVSDTPGEALYLRDEETGQVWSPTPLPAGSAEPYLIRHGAGYTLFEHHSHGLIQQLELFVAPDAPVKVMKLRVENALSRTRRITATYYVEWVLGVMRESMQPYVIPEYDDETHALLARNPYDVEFGERVAFLAANKTPHGLTADRAEFLGRMGSYQNPAALARVGLLGQVVAGRDPCAAIMLHLDLPPGGSEEIYFLLGQGRDRTEALQLIKRYQVADEVTRSAQAARQRWDEILGAVTVRTPDRALDILLNRWLLYQSLSCRMWGRSALYQSSGAFGFRDQLQDSLAYLYTVSEVTRQHLLEAARHQFEAGDVLHWWHPPSGRGLRSRCSDDLVWLPYVTAHYVLTTGDATILTEKAPFLRGTALEPEEAERYGQYEWTTETYTLYEHCQRALKKGLTSGPHGLPLMGTGDWNDGMNRVGVGGKGESVWLGWFLCATLLNFAVVCEAQGDKQQADQYRQQAHELQQALEAQAWDGAWYRRAFYDDGSPLGSSQNRECQIDSIAQSWAVLSGVAQPDRARQAMEAVARQLVREDQHLIMLFTPPFDQTKRDPGYIKGYVPGIRENGGQYTHAALWAVWAFAELGQGNRAGHLFSLLNPILHGQTSNNIKTYQVEPYVVAADVYSVSPHIGQGGWTWYTGSASWMYRLGVEALLGLRREGQHLRLKPCIPAAWPNYQITYRYGTSIYHIQVQNPTGVESGVKQITLDNQPLPDQLIPLQADGQVHEVVVELGLEPAS